MERAKVQPTDILKMLENLYDLAVERPRTVAGSLVWGLNKEEVAMQIAKIRASLPTELKQAASLAKESEKIVENAKEDATLTLERARREAEKIIEAAKLDAKNIVENSRQEARNMVEEARLRQEQMLTESDMVRLAQERCEELWEKANRDVQEVRRGAESYAYDVLCHLESVVSKIMSSVEAGKSELRQEDLLKPKT
jgi:cell division septum initiation protein DivIVA